jgi:hypothetical protein
VLDTPYFVRPDSSGNFHLSDVPPVEGDLVVWNERAQPWHAVVRADVNPKIGVNMELTQRRIPQHMNKFGKPYGRDPNGGY